LAELGASIPIDEVAFGTNPAPARSLFAGVSVTKTFETLKTLPAGEMLAWVESDSNQQRGEFVLVIDAAPPLPETTGLSAEVLHTLEILAAELPTKQAATLAATLTGANKKVLYDHALKMKTARQEK